PAVSASMVNKLKAGRTYRRSDKRSAIRQNNGAAVKLSPVALALTGERTVGLISVAPSGNI
ncbi:hypothetical protein, partial [Klebsiella aerogenes]|uniref:hypothetical protein n=1 Tax=Klebsiella aerogenes TaxID=548 RepID=UPI00280FF8EF